MGTGEEIKESYLRIVKECHPDVKPSDEAASRRFHEVSQARATLINESLRRMYDLHLHHNEGRERRAQREQEVGKFQRIWANRSGPAGAMIFGAATGAIVSFGFVAL